MKLTKFNKSRARTEILHYVLSFCTSTKYLGDNISRAGATSFVCGNRMDVIVGDLVIIQSARSSKWTIGWLREIERKENEFCDRYAIESIEDGEIADWRNISLKYFPRDELPKKWMWNDRQFAFNDRWMHLCFKTKDCDWERPNLPMFADDHSVTLTMRKKFSDEIIGTTVFPDWRKTTIKHMGDFVDECLRKDRCAP